MIVLVTEAQPARLRELVLALLDMDDRGAGLHICTKASPLLDVPLGATVVLRLRAEDNTWLNYTRPIFAERQWRAVLWDEDGATLDIKATAPDFFDWISHVVECPGGVPGFAVRGLQSAPPFPGVIWRGAGFARALAAAAPDAGTTALSARAPYAEMVATARQAPGWLVYRDLASARDLVRLRWALAESGRSARCALIEPTVKAPGWWPVSDAFATWEQMLDEIGGDDAAAAALVAALLEREPGTGALAGALRQAGTGLDEIAVELRSAADPGAALARMAHARGLIRAEDVIERSAAPAVLRGLDHDATIEQARAQLGASVHAALAAWRAGRADEWSLAEAAMSSWAATAPADVPALPAERPERWSSVYWLEATLGQRQPAPAALAWAQELAHADVVAHWEQAYGHGRSEASTQQQEDEMDMQRARVNEGGMAAQRLQRDHARRLTDLADLLRQQGRHDEAERLARQALDVVEASVGAEHPDVATVLDVLARVLASWGRYNEAVDVLRRAVAITEQVLGPAHPAAAARRRSLAPLETRIAARSAVSAQAPRAGEPAPSMVSHKNGGGADVLARLDEDSRAAVHTLLLEQSREYYEKILELALRLVEANPENAEWQRDLSIAYGELGDVEMAAGNLNAARARFDGAMTVIGKLVTLAPHDARYQCDLFAARLRLAQLDATEQQFAQARSHLDTARSVLARLDAAGLLRGDAQLDEYRQRMIDLERKLPPA